MNELLRTASRTINETTAAQMRRPIQLSSQFAIKFQFTIRRASLVKFVHDILFSFSGTVVRIVYISYLYFIMTRKRTL